MNPSTNPIFIYKPTTSTKFKGYYISTFFDIFFGMGVSPKYRKFHQFIFHSSIIILIILAILIPFYMPAKLTKELELLVLFVILSIFLYPACLAWIYTRIKIYPIIILSLNPLSSTEKEQVKANFSINDKIYFFPIKKYRYDFLIETSKHFIICGFDKTNNKNIKLTYPISKIENKDVLQKIDLRQELKPYYKKYIKL
ncbi:hypothetical protein [Lactobacillus sp. LL6]|uniref:hypothetical protein n=1 Tax=Lactobacillus sp. LL6 TaxID=2596827 RepID=UPI001184C8E5|nr:hypothetical protein [Lactobacillus sp. LL6]TSO26302.1 hypothetical protein FOD82_04325 [Lactobacillus sp. LL6]